jgi:hypothetical protein
MRRKKCWRIKLTSSGPVLIHTMATVDFCFSVLHTVYYNESVLPCEWIKLYVLHSLEYVLSFVSMLLFLFLFY